MKLKRASDKRRKISKKYLRLRAEFLKKNPICWWCIYEKRYPWLRSQKIHHQKGRGKHLLDVDNWMAVSREGYNWIHSHPKKAREKGYTLPCEGES